MVAYGHLNAETELWFDDVMQATDSTVVTLYRRDVAGDYLPVFWVPRTDTLEPAHVSSASDLASHLRALNERWFEMDSSTFRDGPVRRGLEAFGVSQLFVVPLANNGEGRYFITAGTSTAYDERAHELLVRHAERVSEALSAATLRARVRGTILPPYGDGSASRSQRPPAFGALPPLQLLAETAEHGSFVELAQKAHAALGKADLKLAIEDRDGLLLADAPDGASLFRIKSWLTLFSRLPYLDWMEDSRRPVFVPTTDNAGGIGRLVIPLFGQNHLYGLICAWPLTHEEVEEHATLLVELRLAALYLVHCREASRGRILKRSLSSVENERALIAKELHDETSQTLVALKVRLATAQRALDRGSLGDARGIIEDCTRIADEALAGVNRLSSDLRPSELSYLGLRPAIEAVAEKRLARVPMSYTIGGNAADIAFGALQERRLLEGVSEAIANCARHSHASLVEIEMRQEGGWFTIAIRDDGRGFTLAEGLQGLGMRTMQDCAEELGGDFWVGSDLGHGTMVRFSVPSILLEEVEHG